MDEVPRWFAGRSVVAFVLAIVVGVPTSGGWALRLLILQFAGGVLWLRSRGFPKLHNRWYGC
ncbi:MAG: hypothetical protein L3K04_05050 [Thermoplasmata archaeon]|nr:hypothetical protein [Thermoplasmata archaeon]